MNAIHSRVLGLILDFCHFALSFKPPLLKVSGNGETFNKLTDFIEYSFCVGSFLPGSIRVKSPGKIPDKGGPPGAR